ncbi:hypothetical protein ASG43_05335 [Aureimonas sp. Leaf454]|uniref:hypothetical protein n=1 Tax=Aureimonas sp. Leaf454 TaxID=1736381 RepID=UPI0006FAE81A|nr:hypothetical protein [Aureimonas sp. Leaf454]KQT50706.1 hypothetical protein ASG43_05335 [Aureimonas sp. Leaf454]
MKTPSEDYKAAQALAFGLVDFAKRISGGEADFAAGLASTRAAGPQTWFRTGDLAEAAVDEAAVDEAAVDEAIAVCGGDPRAAIRSLIVMTAFLENEAHGRQDR